MQHYEHSLAAHFDQVLAASEAALRAALDTGNKQELADGQSGSAEVRDFKDLAGREQEHDIAAMEAARVATELSQVLAARRRLRERSFGQCVECGKPIDLLRLQALPAAAFCVDCQAAGEKVPAAHPQSAGI